jgi:hypothetical protein
MCTCSQTTMGVLIMAHKGKLFEEIENQLTLGPEGLEKEDGFLLECNFDDLSSTGHSL